MRVGIVSDTTGIVSRNPPARERGGGMSVSVKDVAALAGLRAEVAGAEEREQVVFQPELVVRESTRSRA